MQQQQPGHKVLNLLYATTKFLPEAMSVEIDFQPHENLHYILFSITKGNNWWWLCILLIYSTGVN